jgi:hypothetical protein
VREFGDLSGAWYPWMRDSPVSTRGRLALILELTDVDVEFDAFGTPRLTPDDYGRYLCGLAVVTEDGAFVADPVNFLEAIRREVRTAHASLYRMVAGWSPRDRFLAGASSYARMWAAFVEAGQGSPEDLGRLVLEPLRQADETCLDAHLAADAEPAIWIRAREHGGETLFAPLLAFLDDAPVEAAHG